MVRKEKLGYRDLNYSKWHRTLPSNCYAMDLDWIEFRRNEIVALIETKHYRAKDIGSFQRKIMLKIARALKVPAIYVKYNLEIEDPVFHLEDIKSGYKKTMTENEYRNWLINL